MVFLGFNTIKNLALSIAAIGMLQRAMRAGLMGSSTAAFTGNHGDCQTAGNPAGRCRSRIALSPACCMILEGVLAQFLPAGISTALQASAAEGISLHAALQRTGRQPCRGWCHAGGGRRFAPASGGRHS